MQILLFSLLLIFKCTKGKLWVFLFLELKYRDQNFYIALAGLYVVVVGIQLLVLHEKYVDGNFSSSCWGFPDYMFQQKLHFQSIELQMDSKFSYLMWINSIAILMVGVSLRNIRLFLWLDYARISKDYFTLCCCCLCYDVQLTVILEGFLCLTCREVGELCLDR